MSLKEDIIAGWRKVPNALSNPNDDLFPIGVTVVGKKHIPNFLQKIGCVSIFAVPIVGGVITVVNSIATHGYENTLPLCAGSIGLLIFAAGTTLRLRKR